MRIPFGMAALSLATLVLSLPASAQYAQTKLVSNIPGLAAISDPLLVNPWGISRSATSSFWTSNQGTNTSTLYAITGGTSVGKVVAGPQGPTGQVNNTNTASFQLVPGNAATAAQFIFADLNGTISRWGGGLTSTIEATTPGGVYTGLTINATGTRLYAAETWSDISGDLPDFPMNTIAADPVANVLYVGTDAGVFATADGGIHWADLVNGSRELRW